jgi:transcriptional regulator with XRE-family HTH domain
MDNEQLKLRIGNNIAAYRKRDNMTQAELADRLNYSDKAVSKWERGDSVPDVITLVQLAEQFGITVNDLLAQPENIEPTEPMPVKPKANKGIIQTLASLLVWFVALTIYVILSSVDVPKSEVAFVYAIPTNAIVLLCLRSAFGRFGWNHTLVSLIVWGALLSIYTTLLVFAGFNLWKIFLLGFLGQAAVTLWFHMFRSPRKGANHG